MLLTEIKLSPCPSPKQEKAKKRPCLSTPSTSYTHADFFSATQPFSLLINETQEEVRVLNQEAQERVNKQLFNAIEKGCLDEVNNAVKAGANVNAQNNDGERALLRAIKKDQAEIALALIPLISQEAIDAVDDGGCTALIAALRYGYLDIAEALIPCMHPKVLNYCEEFYGDSALSLAFEHGDLELISSLISHIGPDEIGEPEGNTILMQLICNGHLDLALALIPRLNSETINTINNSSDDTALTIALYDYKNENNEDIACRLNIVRALIPLMNLKAIKSVNDAGDTALSLAIQNHRLDIAAFIKETIILHFANYNIPKSSIHELTIKDVGQEFYDSFPKWGDIHSHSSMTHEQSSLINLNNEGEIPKQREFPNDIKKIIAEYSRGITQVPLAMAAIHRYLKSINISIEFSIDATVKFIEEQELSDSSD